jgi:DNA-binding response OmpR family regulator
MMALVADEDEKNLENISVALKICLPDYKLETTDSGKKCLEMVKSKSPDIVILGGNLPDGDSFDVLKQIRVYSQVPVIFLSNKREEHETIKALEMGADGYMTKPLRQLEFMARVRALLRKQ